MQFVSQAFNGTAAVSSRPSLVTIITRTYPGRAHYLARAAQSVVSQDYSFIEWIVVEDGGDTLGNVVKEARRYGLNARHIPSSKVGRSAAANVGLEQASGDLIGFLDDDDELFPWHVTTLAGLLATNPSVACAYAASEAALRGRDGSTVSASIHYTTMASSAILLETNPFPIQAPIFRKSALGLTRFREDFDALEDWLFWTHLLLEREIVGTPSVTSRYYLPAESADNDARLASHRDHEEKFREARDAFLRVRGAWNVGEIVLAHNERLRREAMAGEPTPLPPIPQAPYFELQARRALSPSWRNAPRKTSNRVAFTSVTFSYLPKALVWADSFRALHPDWDIHILLNDAWLHDTYLHIGGANAIVEARDIGMPGFHGWVFGMDEEELSCATRPFYFDRLLSGGYEQVFFFDPDILMVSPIEFISEIAAKSGVVLTPHNDAPALTEEEIHFTEMSVLAHGVFNLGFIAVANNETGRAVVEFWKERLLRYCVKDHARGLWTDQKWFNLVPLYFPDVAILRNKGCNVASWNVAHRPITERGGRLYAGGEPLAFFHFSGIDSGGTKAVSDMLRGSTASLEKLINGYVDKLAQEKAACAPASIPWVYKLFDNGEPIPTGVKRFYRGTLDNRLTFPQPFFTKVTPSFYDHVSSLGIEGIEQEYNSATKLRRYF